MRGAGKSFRYIRFVRVDAFKPNQVLVGTQPHSRRLVRNETVDRAVDAEKPAFVIYLDDGEPAFRTVGGSGYIVGSLLNCLNLFVLQLERRVDDDAIECAGVVLQDFFQIGAKRTNIGGMILGIPQHLNLLKQTTAVGEHRKCEILIYMNLLVDDPAFVRLADSNDE